MKNKQNARILHDTVLIAQNIFRIFFFGGGGIVPRNPVSYTYETTQVLRTETGTRNSSRPPVVDSR